MIEIPSEIKQLKKKINSRIDSHMDHYEKTFNDIGTQSKEALQKLRQFAKSGKGIRGGLFVLTSRLFGNQDAFVFDIGAALELVQASLLIHDDIMDNDFIRRGKPSLFAQYIASDKTSIDYGKSMAICVGDIGFFIAMDICNRALQNHPQKDEALHLLFKELIIVGLAQMNDVTFATKKDMPAKEDILRMYLYKTAHYTFSLPMRLGAIISKQSTPVQEQVEKLGESLGILFQLTDDMLGIFSSEKIAGKPIGSDLRENKKTFMKSLLYQKATSDEVTKIESFQNKTEINSEDLQYFVALIDKYDVKTEIDQITRSYQSKAQKLIKELRLDKNSQLFLENFVQYIANRSS